MRLLGTAQALSTLPWLLPTFFPCSILALQLDPTNPDSVRETAKNVAEVLVSMYADTKTGVILSGIPGLLTYPPYYWWEAGAMFGQLIDYWYYTGDGQWNDLVREGILHQTWGDENQQNFMPANQSKDMGNDDQLFWAFTVMSAAEYNFPAPPSDQLGWLGLAQSIYNQLSNRWDPETCGGGIRWQVLQWSPGYNYKNIAANGGYFQLAARLALYTGNDTYAKKAEEMFDWLENVSPLMTNDYVLHDGCSTLTNCSKADSTNPWSYNYGIMIGGAAYMYNYTNGSDIWATRLNGFINKTNTFFQPKYKSVMLDLCEIPQKCNIDQVSFKGYLARWFALSIQLAPITSSQLIPLLQRSGIAAAQSCVGPANTSSLPYACGNRWYWDGFDGNGGAGQQIAALSVISANLISQEAPILKVGTGGTSKGDPGAGTNLGAGVPVVVKKVTGGNRVGAAVLTIMSIGGTLGGAWYLFME